MNFEELFKTVSPKLRKLARNYNSRIKLIDENDLYQEACTHLWNNFREGLPEGKNEFYVVRGCEFHLLNYLRKMKEKAWLSSLDETINEEGDVLRDVLPDTNYCIKDSTEKNITVSDIMNNGFSPREKQVFAMLLKGFTVREVGKELGISHVMVVKSKNRLIKKWQNKDKRLPI